MATEEFLKRSIVGHKPYDSLPDRIKAILSYSEWKLRHVADCCYKTGMQLQLDCDPLLSQRLIHHSQQWTDDLGCHASARLSLVNRAFIACMPM